MEKQEFVELLHNCIRDEFIAITTASGSEISVRFTNGLTYSIVINSNNNSNCEN